MSEATFELSLSTWSGPANDEGTLATPVVVSSTAHPCASPLTFTLDGATPSIPPTFGMGPERDIWYSFVAPLAAAGTPYSGVVLRLGDNDEQMLQGGMQLRDGGGPDSRLLAGDAWNSRGRIIGPGFSYDRLTPGRTYYIRFFSALAQPEPFTRFTFCLSASINDEPCTALPLPPSPSGECLLPVQGTTYRATRSRSNAGLDWPTPNCGGQDLYDVWYRVEPTTTAFTLHSDDITIGQARLYQTRAPGGACTEALELVSCQASAVSGVREVRALGTVMFENLVPGKSYFLAVSNANWGLDPRGPFTLCAQAAPGIPLAARATTLPLTLTLWPNPVIVGETLQVRLPAGIQPAPTVRVEWLSATGQVVSAPAAERELAVVEGVVRLPTVGRRAGLYLLRFWLPTGQPLPVQRVLLQ